MASERLLGEFLRARRAVTTPAQVGLPDAGRRRTPGLRRGEVATLAAVSTDYYIRLEQGRERHPSDQVIGALAEVFGLGPDATAHLYALARTDMPVHRGPRAPAAATARVSPHLIRLMCTWQTPAFVMSRCMDVLTVNPLATAFYGRGLHSGLKAGDNVLGTIFLDAAARRFYPDWEPIAHAAVAHLRATVGRDLDDPRLAELVDELSGRSGDFRRMWARHDVQTEISHVIRLHHDLVGELTVDYDMFSVTEAPGQQLVTIQATPGSPSADALAVLCRQARERDPASGHPTRCSDAETERLPPGGASC
ncbi:MULTISPECIES: helix-turn-helix transcriptional regulator [unclassified Streptosporangium]|uniref:helix-turn-helix transcriptional regulator n=1 Tax=unclassified Streptosporangium TaxID=2632669 RepID=UPI002E2A2C8E|nr:MULTISPECIES: helix-turn-helix transcriptional regulator [unclassified Streptosporangium]